MVVLVASMSVIHGGMLCCALSWSDIYWYMTVGVCVILIIIANLLIPILLYFYLDSFLISLIL